MTRVPSPGVALLAVLAMLLGAAGPARPAATAAPRAAGAIVSLDYCADQFVLALAPRARILALSMDADDRFSYLREAARGLRQVRAVAEDVLILGPDLVVRSYGGGASAPHFFRRAGVPVLQMGFVQTFADIRDNIRLVAAGLGVAARGEALIARMDRRLAAVRRHRPGTRALYLTPGGYTAGPGTLVHEMLAAAGLENFQRAPGWRPLPLERLAYERPDLIVTAFFDTRASSADAWTAAQHPVARRRMAAVPAVHLHGSWISCGGWFVADAVAALARGGSDRPH